MTSDIEKLMDKVREAIERSGATIYVASGGKKEDTPPKTPSGPPRWGAPSPNTPQSSKPKPMGTEDTMKKVINSKPVVSDLDPYKATKEGYRK